MESIPAIGIHESGPTNLQIRRLEKQDCEPISAAFTAMGWNKPVSQYERYFAAQEAGDCVVLVAVQNDVFAGYLKVEWQTDYQPFFQAGIPEIRDFNMLAQFRRQGIGSRLMDAAEKLASERSAIVGIGVGMMPDYGPAQRMYVLRGYVPDGRGLMTETKPITYGQQVRVDDSLVLYFTKAVRY